MKDNWKTSASYSEYSPSISVISRLAVVCLWTLWTMFEHEPNKMFKVQFSQTIKPEPEWRLRSGIRLNPNMGFQTELFFVQLQRPNCWTNARFGRNLLKSILTEWNTGTSSRAEQHVLLFGPCCTHSSPSSSPAHPCHSHNSPGSGVAAVGTYSPNNVYCCLSQLSSCVMVVVVAIQTLFSK